MIGVWCCIYATFIYMTLDLYTRNDFTRLKYIPGLVRDLFCLSGTVYNRNVIGGVAFFFHGSHWILIKESVLLRQICVHVECSSQKYDIVQTRYVGKFSNIHFVATRSYISCRYFESWKSLYAKTYFAYFKVNNQIQWKSI